MNIFRTTKTIYFLFFLTTVLNPYSYAIPAFLEISIKDLPIKKKQIFSAQKNHVSDPIFEKNPLNFLNNHPELAINKPISKSQELEIQSDEQYQENNVIYAEGNVLVTFKGNILNADSLIYDKLNE